MQVQRVLLPASRRESWTVLGEDDTPLAPIERYLAYLSDIEKSPNTVKAYAHDLSGRLGMDCGTHFDSLLMHLLLMPTA